MDTFKGEDAYDKAWDFLKKQVGDKSGPKTGCDRVIVENQTKYDLEYVTHSYKVGWPVGDVKKGFEDRGDCTFVLPPGSVGTQLWNLHQGGGFFKFMTAGVIATSCTESYFSVRIRTQGKNYIVCCGSTVGMNRCNKAGIQIRGEDGVLDGNGNIAGHGVDPTGNVTDIEGLVQAVHHATPGNWVKHQFSEVTKSFEVICKFNNEFLGLHHFIFKKGREDEEQKGEEEAAGTKDVKNDPREEIFSKYDTDGDGVLSLDEFKNMMKK